MGNKPNYEVADVANRLFDYGALIPKEWLIEQFGIKVPGKLSTREEWEQYQFDFLNCMDNFNKAMLYEHGKPLQNIRGNGWRVVPPAEHTGFSMNLAIKDFYKAVNRSLDILDCSPADKLTNRQAAENADARGKLGALRAFARKNTFPDRYKYRYKPRAEETEPEPEPEPEPELA